MTPSSLRLSLTVRTLKRPENRADFREAVELRLGQLARQESLAVAKEAAAQALDPVDLAAAETVDDLAALLVMGDVVDGAITRLDWAQGNPLGLNLIDRRTLETMRLGDVLGAMSER